MNFCDGDVVKLKSGGPQMTVSFVGEKVFPHGEKVPVVECTWFEGKNLRRDTFKPEILVSVKHNNYG